MKWSTHISEFENLLPNTDLQVEKALELYDAVIPKKRGKVVFLAGERGSGRSEALKAIAETLPQKHKNIQVISGKFTDGKYLAISAKSGGFSRNAEVAGNILALLAKVIALKTGLPIDLISESAAFLFEFIAQLLETSATVKSALDDLNDNPPNIADLPNVVKKLLRAAAHDSPVICLFDDFDEARYEWHEFIDSFAEEIGKDLPILFFISLRGSSKVGEHQKGETNLEMVTRRTISRGLAEWWYLQPMTSEEIAAWIAADTDLGMVAQLHGVTGGIPRWVKELWRDWKTFGFVNFNHNNNRWEWSKDKHPTLNPFNDVLKDLIALLLKTNDLVKITEAREILAAAALEGTKFTAEVVALTLDLDTEELNEIFDDYLLQNKENPNGILKLEPQPDIEIDVSRYSFVSEWHWQVLDRYALTETEKRQKSAEMITALQIAYQKNENLIARSLSKLYQNIGNNEQARHFQTMASYSDQIEIMYQHAQRVMALKINDWDKFQCYQHAKFLYEAGDVIQFAYPFEETIKVFEYAEKLARKAGAVDIQAKAIYKSGFLYFAEGEYKKAKENAEISHKLFEGIKSRHGKSVCLHLLGQIAYSQGDYIEAKSKANESSKINEELGDKDGKSSNLHLLGQIAHSQGDYIEAKSKVSEALEIIEELGDKDGKSGGLHLLGQIAHSQGDYIEAKSKVSEALEINEELGDKNGKSASLHLLAQIAYSQGKTEISISFSSLGIIISSLIKSGNLEIFLSDFNVYAEKLNYSEDVIKQIKDKAKSEYAKDEGRSWIEELLRNW